ncbi:hypothetical protein BCR44DRAFT_181295 [Catenaria anguillulae PL171]|uniref:Uncharacterized protein n=1 Tax=Catenaria anguillulae PL171 TaxID=765915 RepID=A0A1Y2HGL0_9FUNG|nr:hypothetical protein BCR44DRAFT_181295 [Catenaria anguillulae PL171]
MKISTKGGRKQERRIGESTPPKTTKRMSESQQRQEQKEIRGQKEATEHTLGCYTATKHVGPSSTATNQPCTSSFKVPPPIPCRLRPSHPHGHGHGLHRYRHGHQHVVHRRHGPPRRQSQTLPPSIDLGHHRVEPHVACVHRLDHGHGAPARPPRGHFLAFLDGDGLGTATGARGQSVQTKTGILELRHQTTGQRPILGPRGVSHGTS